MKKIISLIGIVAIMLLMTLTAFAGDVPEALGYEDDAQIFIGTLAKLPKKVAMPPFLYEFSGNIPNFVKSRQRGDK